MERRSAAEWRELIEEFRQSGLEQKEFCSRRGLNLHSLQFWLYRRPAEMKCRSSGSDSGSSPAFVPVEVVASPAPQAREGVIEVALRSGVVLRFSAGLDTRYVAELIAALG